MTEENGLHLGFAITLARAVVSWPEVVVCLIVSVLLLSHTTYLSRYLSKEKIVLTIP